MSAKRYAWRLFLVSWILAAMLAFLASWVIESQLVDARGLNARASLVTRELAPGDHAVIRMDCSEDLECLVDTAWAQLVSPSGPLSHEPQKMWTAPHAGARALFDIHIPDTVAVGPLVVRLKVEMAMKTEVDRLLWLVSYTGHRRTDRLELPLEITSDHVRTLRRWLFRVLALVAWCGAVAIACWIARRPLGQAEFERKLPPYVQRFNPRFRAALCFVALVGLIAVGDIAFLRPVGRTLEHPWKWIDLALSICWGLAICIGTMLGYLAAARDHRWVPIRLRAVIGPARESGYRQPAVELPAELDREALALTSVELSSAMQKIGCSAAEHRRWTTILIEGRPLLRWRGRKREPWRPADLELEIAEAIDPTPLFEVLANLYGPLEIRLLRRAPVIVVPVGPE